MLKVIYAAVCLLAFVNSVWASNSREICAPSILLTTLSDDMKIGIAGANKIQLASLYDSFFQMLKRCNLTKNVEFTVTESIGHWPSWIRKPTNDNTYKYNVTRTTEHGYCISRFQGSEAAHLDTKWYCEYSGWISLMQED